MSASKRTFIIIYDGGETWQGYGLLYDILNQFPYDWDLIDAIIALPD
jgi:hypothetical protein